MEDLKTKIRDIKKLTNGLIYYSPMSDTNETYSYLLIFPEHSWGDVVIRGEGGSKSLAVESLMSNFNQWIQKRKDAGIKLPWSDL